MIYNSYASVFSMILVVLFIFNQLYSQASCYAKFGLLQFRRIFQVLSGSSSELKLGKMTVIGVVGQNEDIID